MKGSLSRQSSLTNINHNVNQALGISSQYDFEKENYQQKIAKINEKRIIALEIFCAQPQIINQIHRKKQNKKIDSILTYQKHPPLGYYKLNESSLIQKSVVDMSKQPTTQIQIRKYKSKSIDQESQLPQPLQLEQQKQIQMPRINQLSNLKLQEWISKELEQLKDAKKFIRNNLQRIYEK